MLLPAVLLLAPPADPRSDEAPAPIAWPAGPLEAWVAFEEPIDIPETNDADGGPIAFGMPMRLDERFGAAGAIREPLGTLAIAGVRAEDGGRTLVLLTDPHPTEAVYVADLPGGLGTVAYDLSGVEAFWEPEGQGGEPWAGWLPELDLGRSRELTAASAEHARAFARFAGPGTLTLRTLLELPEGESTVIIESDRPFEAELMYVPMGVAPAGGEPGRQHRGEAVVDGFGEAVELYVTLPTGGPAAPSLVASAAPGDGDPAPIDRRVQILPWAPPPMTPEGDVPFVPEALLGGDPGRGEAVFFGEAGKCSACHRVGDRGGQVGPDLTGVADRLDAAALHHAIAAPSAAIAPEYLPYTVATTDGRVFVGILRAEDADAIRLVDADAKAEVLRRDEIEEIRPVATSIMPVGLAGALGEADLRDLMAFLLTLRGEHGRPAVPGGGRPEALSPGPGD